ncbi:MAG: hypothetical protein JOZ80_11625 [Acidobacteriaceae bacterium]|nr:hypothetical protein [Acidobacteriaceae bacterium]
MQNPPQIEKNVSDASWLLEQFARMQDSVRRASTKNALMDEAFGPWAIANRVCDRYQIPKIGSWEVQAVQL